MTLEQLKEEESKIRLLLNENLQKQKEIKIKMFSEKHGIQIGDLIEYEHNYTIKQGVLFKFNLNMYSNSIVVKPINKDGKTGKSTHYNIKINNVKVLQKKFQKIEYENE